MLHPEYIVTTLAFLEATCSQAHSDDAFEQDATENFGVPTTFWSGTLTSTLSDAGIKNSHTASDLLEIYKARRMSLAS
jgi:hypothetical protein